MKLSLNARARIVAESYLGTVSQSRSASVIQRFTLFPHSLPDTQRLAHPDARQSLVRLYNNNTSALLWLLSRSTVV